MLIALASCKGLQRVVDQNDQAGTACDKCIRSAGSFDRYTINEAIGLFPFQCL